MIRSRSRARSLAAAAAMIGLLARASPAPAQLRPPSRRLEMPPQRANPAALPKAHVRRRADAETDCGGTSSGSTGVDSFVGGAAGNTAFGDYAAVLAGLDNQACDIADAVGGGAFNIIAYSTSDGSSVDSFIGAGANNMISSQGSFIGAGDSAYSGKSENEQVSPTGPGNVVSGEDSFIGTGDLNAVSANGSFIGAGGFIYASTKSGGSYPTTAGNQVVANDSFIGAGDQNVVEANESAIAGGASNVVTTSGPYSFVGAGLSNEATDTGSVVGGGIDNQAGGQYSFVGAGDANTAAAFGGAVVAGYANVAAGYDSFAGAGAGNSAGGNGSFVGAGGYTFVHGGGLSPANQVTGVDSFLGAGDQNSVAGGEAFLGSGLSNSITSAGQYGSLIGGRSNTVSAGSATVIGGYDNTASGLYAIVAGGYLNTAAGELSYAAGYHADAAHNGSFVWSDYTAGTAALKDSAVNQFLVRASGGVYVYSNEKATTGVELAPGSGTWSSLSDRNAKTAIVPLDDDAILAKVVTMPIDSWQYKSEKGVSHVGPMAQDFYAAFGTGIDNRHITSIDEDGVALAAIKALHRENGTLRSRLAILEARDRENDALRATLELRSALERERLEAKNASLEHRLDLISARLRM